LPDGVESHQRKGDSRQRDDDIEHPHQNTDLGDVLARQQIVGDVDPAAQQIEIGGNLQYGCRGPSEQANGGEREKPREISLSVIGKRRSGKGDRQRDKEQG
jgi:hypothetical protein